MSTQLEPRPLAASDRGEGPYMWRFSPLERVLHVMVIVSFFGLVLTGLPLHFSHEPWAEFLIRLHGGTETAGVIHRMCAVITFTYFFIHIGTIVRRLVRAQDRRRMLWGPDSMVPQPKDIRDLFQMFKWFFGLGKPPKFDRFSYLEKFDYWAVFWGIAVIGGSGLVLWFPEFFARWLPGWAFNVATIIHGDEALLALTFIFTVHFFNGQLRPDKFPLDLVIFTGRATKEYMDDEHPLEVERLEAEGSLEQRVAPPPQRGLYVAAAVFGAGAILVGLTIAGLVVWAILK
jgi:cytochrome b subunit of formate dehydrogenase